MIASASQRRLRRGRRRWPTGRRITDAGLPSLPPPAYSRRIVIARLKRRIAGRGCHGRQNGLNRACVALPLPNCALLWFCRGAREDQMTPESEVKASIRWQPNQAIDRRRGHFRQRRTSKRDRRITSGFLEAARGLLEVYPNRIIHNDILYLSPSALNEKEPLKTRQILGQSASGASCSPENSQVSTSFRTQRKKHVEHSMKLCTYHTGDRRR